jgi:hypothetical protein
MNRKFRKSVWCSLCLLALAAESSQARFLSEKQARKRPRGRIGCVASPTAGTCYPDPCALGSHAYTGGFFHSLFHPAERNGIVYTCRGGFIDITHTRKLADWAAYLAYQIRAAIRANQRDFSFQMREPSRSYVRIEYPPDWDQWLAGTRDAAATEVSIQLASYLAYTACIWHEMLTWFGYKAIGFYPEFNSAFSWEDCYSNALGCRIAEVALRDPNQEFDQAVTLLFKRELERLKVQPRPAAWVAGRAVHGQWFTGNYFWFQIIKRNFDIGTGDDFVTPWPVPGLSACDEARPENYPVPTLASVQQHGFAITYEIEPREWERRRMLALIYGPGGMGRIEPARHFGPILDYIKAQAVVRYGPEVGNPSTRAASPLSSNAPDLSTLAARWLREETS